jgi:hypothetical protein
MKFADRIYFWAVITMKIIKGMGFVFCEVKGKLADHSGRAV